MRNYLFIALSLFAFAACHENIEERAEREANEFTKRNCPSPITQYISIDSMTFEKQTRTIHYYFSMSGNNDTTSVNNAETRKAIVDAIKDNTGMKKYKDEGFNFAYTYMSTKHKGQVLIDVKVTPKDYDETRK